MFFFEQGDADVQIVSKALQLAEKKNTVLVGDDTDLLVLLLHHCKSTKKIYFAPEPKKNSKSRVWDIKQVKSDLGTFLCQYILFAHAISGSDTTSRLFGLGKGTILKMLKENVQLQQAALVFDNPRSNHNQIEEAGEKALVAIYGGKKTDNLNQLRFKMYTEKVATCTILFKKNATLSVKIQ